MTRDEFYQRFPWIFRYPASPCCSECMYQSSYKLIDGCIHLVESHLEKCSRFAEHDGQVHVLESV